jgi:hypothetical protein
VNVKNYILSGVIESYVLGLSTETEQQEFEVLYKQYPQIAQAKLDFELSLETLLMKSTIAPLITKRKETLSSNPPVKYHLNYKRICTATKNQITNINSCNQKRNSIG